MKSQESKYQRAKERVKEIKGWYTHLSVYILVNTILQLLYAGYIDGLQLYVGESMFGRFFGPIVWGSGLILHGIWVFKSPYLRRLYKNWEERKIKKFMEKDTNTFNDY